MRDPVFPTRSGRRPGQGILRECFMGPVQPGLQARRVPRWLVMITSGPEDQESGQSSESGQWSLRQDSLLINRIFSWIAKYICPTLHLHHCCTLLFGSEGAPDRLCSFPANQDIEIPAVVVLRSAQEASVFQPVAAARSSRSIYWGFVSGSRSPGQISSFRRDSVLGLPGTLDFQAPGILSAMTQRCWYNLTPRPASQNNRALDRRVFLAS